MTFHLTVGDFLVKHLFAWQDVEKNVDFFESINCRTINVSGLACWGKLNSVDVSTSGAMNYELSLWTLLWIMNFCEISAVYTNE